MAVPNRLLLLFTTPLPPRLSCSLQVSMCGTAPRRSCSWSTTRSGCGRSGRRCGVKLGRSVGVQHIVDCLLLLVRE